MHSLAPILVALCFNALDLITGLVGAVRNHDLQSSKMRDGLFKKVGFIFCYALAFIIDYYGYVIGLNLGVKVLPIIVLYAVATEIVSIIENICEINTELTPDALKKLFHINEVNKDDKD